MTMTWNAHCPAIECEGCANSIQRSLGRLQGVEDVAVDIIGKTVAVRYDDAQVTETSLRERLEQAGFPAE